MVLAIIWKVGNVKAVTVPSVASASNVVETDIGDWNQIVGWIAVF